MEISLQSVFKNYISGEQITQVLKDVNLQVKAGDFIAITGPSGSGKSTLMNIISCLDKPTQGNYYLKNRDTSNYSEKELARIRNQNFGFVFQAFNLLPQYSALENVELAMLYSTHARKNTKAAARAVLEYLGLENRLDYKPYQLSGGQKQRVAIARAIVNTPSVIIADEPTGSLDSVTGKEVMRIFRDLNKTGKTIILVTHDPEISKKANRIIQIKDGIVKEA